MLWGPGYRLIQIPGTGRWFIQLILRFQGFSELFFETVLTLFLILESFGEKLITLLFSRSLFLNCLIERVTTFLLFAMNHKTRFPVYRHTSLAIGANDCDSFFGHFNAPICEQPPLLTESILAQLFNIFRYPVSPQYS